MKLTEGVDKKSSVSTSSYSSGASNPEEEKRTPSKKSTPEKTSEITVGGESKEKDEKPKSGVPTLDQENEEASTVVIAEKNTPFTLLVTKKNQLNHQQHSLQVL